MSMSFRSLTFVAFLVPVAAAAQDPAVEHVEAAGTQFPVVQSGEGEPVLFVHGAYADHRAWEPLRAEVAESHRFIAYTQRHFGTADWPEEPGMSRDVHEADLVALLEAWGEPMHLVGWSYSGPIVLQAALDRPDLVRSVVIFEPTLDTVLQDKPEHAQALTAWEEGWGPIGEALQGGDAEEAVQRAIEYVFGLPDDGFTTLPEPARAMITDNAHSVPKLAGMPPPTPMTCEDLAGVQAPVLVVWGTETLPFFEAAAKEVAACLPNATLEEIPGVGHGGPIQAREAFVDRMLSFLREVDSSGR